MCVSYALVLTVCGQHKRWLCLLLQYTHVCSVQHTTALWLARLLDSTGVGAQGCVDVLATE